MSHKSKTRVKVKVRDRKPQDRVEAALTAVPVPPHLDQPPGAHHGGRSDKDKAAFGANAQMRSQVVHGPVHRKSPPPNHK